MGRPDVRPDAIVESTITATTTMPDYDVELEGVHTMTGVGKLPVTFTPGQSLRTPRLE